MMRAMSVSQALNPGVILGREFKILRLLRQGGMGSVYEAVQTTTGAPRAIKVMRSAIATDERFRSRFEQEAKVSSRIASDHVVQVVSAGVDEYTQVPWIAMELLEGEDLGIWLEKNQSMGLGDIGVFMGQLCHALGAAHRVGIVHRDLKPENIFLGQARVVGVPFLVKVLDFGVAKVVSEARASTIAVGTPYFMAPEQTHPSSDIMPPTDVWALGLIIYRLLTGQHYWRSANNPDAGLASMWRELLIDPLVSASERATEQGLSHLLPPGFDSWFAHCVAREPTERFANATVAYQAALPLFQTLTLNSPPAINSVPAMSSEPLVHAATVHASAPVDNISPSKNSPYSNSAAATISPSHKDSRDLRKAKVTFREGADRVVVDSDRGSVLLDLSLGAAIQHHHACGGRARCTTCRVVVLDGKQNISPRTEAEAKVAALRKWPDTIRLACQTRVHGDITVRRLVVDADDLATVNALQSTAEPTCETSVIAHIALSGINEFQNQNFPDDVVHVYNRYLTQIVEPALANQGKVVRYTHNGAVLSFGTIGQDNGAMVLDAIRATLRILVRVRQLNPFTLKHFGHEFNINIGVSLGPVIRANLGHQACKQDVTFGTPIAQAEQAAKTAQSNNWRIAATADVVKAMSDGLRLGESTVVEKTEYSEVLDFAQPDTIYLVQSTFELLGNRTEEVASLFYERLFEIYPPAQALFAGTDMSSQRVMLIDVLATAVRSLDNIAAIKPKLEELGARHVAYGVQPFHYRHVGKALLDTLEKMLGNHFTPEVHVAWMEIYGFIAKTMIDAGNQAG